MMNVTLLEGDLTDEAAEIYLNSKFVCVDTETMGLNHFRDRLCLVQICNENDIVYMVRITGKNTPNLKKVMENSQNLKVFHYARFDIGILKHYLGIETKNIYCTKIASKLCRTYTDKHGLKHLVLELLGHEMDKTSQTTDWGGDNFTDEQLEYAAGDVFYLVKIREKLEEKLKRENRQELAQKCFDFLPTLINLDQNGWDEKIFSH